MDMHYIELVVLFTYGIILWINFYSKGRKLPYFLEILICFAIFSGFSIISNEFGLGRYNLYITFVIRFFSTLRDWYLCLLFTSLAAYEYLAKLKKIVLINVIVTLTLMISIGLQGRFFANPDYYEFLYTIWQLSKSIMGIIVYFFGGSLIFYKTYKKSHDKPFIIIFIGCTIASLGWIFHGYGYLVEYLEGEESALLSTISSIITIVGLVLVFITLARNFDYLFRLPDEYYTIIVKHFSGIALFKADIENKNEIVLDENLIAGFLTAINMMFKENLNTKLHLEEVSNGEAVILMRSTEKFTTMVIGSKAPEIINYALDNFVLDFQNTFKKELEEEIGNIYEFSEAKTLVNKHFPFFKIIEKPEDG
jgi:hypothetical protein